MTQFQQIGLVGKSAELRKQVQTLLEGKQTEVWTEADTGTIIPDSTVLSAQPMKAADVVITASGILHPDRIGSIVSNLFGVSKNIFSIRTVDRSRSQPDYGDRSVTILAKNLSRANVFGSVLTAFRNCRPRQVFCVPSSSEELLIAIAVKELFNIPLCLYLVETPFVSCTIPHELMQEALDKASLRLAVSPEMQHECQKRYHLKFWFLPPVFPAALMADQKLDSRPLNDPKTGVMLGDYTVNELGLLKQALRHSEIKIHWYCSTQQATEAALLQQTNLQQYGIFLQPFTDGVGLVQALKNYPFSVVPSAPASGENPQDRVVASMNLPAEVPFLLATAQLPIVVLGSKAAAVSRFVERLEVGVVADYQADTLQQVVAQLTQSSQRVAIGQKAAAIGSVLSNQGIAEWIWRSLEQNEPCDSRFETLVPTQDSDLAQYIDPPVPEGVFWVFVPDYQVMRRLKEKGYRPDFVIDVGASTGIWSGTAYRLFPDARFILVDPLFSRYDPDYRETFRRRNPSFETVEVAISNQPGTISLQVSSDLYGSSLIAMYEEQRADTISVEVKTLDLLAQEKNITGRGLLKADVQLAEHLVLEGAVHLLSQVDVIQLELTLLKATENAKSLLEMMVWLDDLGYRFYDEGGYWRERSGTLVQKDVIFIRKDLSL